MPIIRDFDRVTALYERLSKDDEQQGESNSISAANCMNICVMRYSTKSKSWMYIKIFCFFMMNSSIRLHIPRYKQDFGPAFCDTSQKTRQTHPLCLNFRHRGYLCP